METPLIGKVLIGVVCVLALFGTYKIGYYRGAAFVIETAQERAVDGAINLKNWVFSDKTD